MKLTGLTLAVAMTTALEHSQMADGNKFFVLESREPHPNAAAGYRYYDVLPTFAPAAQGRVHVAVIYADSDASVLVNENPEQALADTVATALAHAGTHTEDVHDGPRALAALAQVNAIARGALDIYNASRSPALWTRTRTAAT